MLSKSSNTRSFHEVLADLRTTRIGIGLPSPTQILHRRNLTTKVQAEIDIKAICSVLQERQLKMMLAHDSSRRAKKVRSLVVGERCYVLGPGNKWIDAFVTRITGSGRSYETEVEATGGHLMRNCSHIRPRSPDIPTKRHSSDLREPQPSPSDSRPASSQPESETTTSESSVSLPSSPSGSSSAESTSTSGTDSSSTETLSKSSSQLSLNISSPETSGSASTSRSTSPELLEMERSFNTLLVGTRDKQGHAMTRSQMRDQQQHITILKQVAMQPQNQPRPVSAPPAANVPLPPYPRRCPSDMGSRKQVQAENANALHKNSSDSDTDRLQDIQEEPRRCIGPSCVKELAKFFTPNLMKRTTAVSTTGQDARISLSQKKRRKEVRNDNVI